MLRVTNSVTTSPRDSLYYFQIVEVVILVKKTSNNLSKWSSKYSHLLFRIFR
jgi:hypothetical protein